MAWCIGCSSIASPVKATNRGRFFAVATERSPVGARLVAIDENGDRQFEVIERWPSIARDSNAAISPDGTKIVFASSRQRSLDVTSLWIAPLGIEQPAVRITTGDWIDTHPVFSPDGQSIIFSSTRGGNFDLWQIQLSNRKLTRLTTDDTHEVMPSVAPDGRIVFAVVTPQGQTPSSHLAVLAQGQVSSITDGPADTAPTFYDNGRLIVFSAPHVRAASNSDAQRVDADLWQVDGTGGRRRLLLDIADTDEGGAVFSSDKRTMLATSLFRANDGTVLFSSVIAVDRQQPITESTTITAAQVRMLKDRAGAIERLNVAVLPSVSVNRKVLASAPEYLPTLRQILREAIERSQKLPPPR
jgi:Tol biopolymer transport system component